MRMRQSAPEGYNQTGNNACSALSSFPHSLSGDATTPRAPQQAPPAQGGRGAFLGGVRGGAITHPERERR
eukprot:5709369-Alexandrium_andersonii.AAC.1